MVAIAVSPYRIVVSDKTASRYMALVVVENILILIISCISQPCLPGTKKIVLKVQNSISLTPSLPAFQEFLPPSSS